MSDQQRCPECREEFAGPIEKTAHRCPGRKSPPEKLAGSDPGQDQLVPDEVIEEARVAGAKAWAALSYAVDTGVCGDQKTEAKRAVARVIAKWAREQERDRIRTRIEQAEVKALRAYEADPCRYHAAQQDLAGDLIDSLTQDDMREATDGCA